MNALWAAAHNADVVIGAVLVLMLALLMIRAFRSARPDPEISRLLRLLNNMPHSAKTGGAPAAAVREDDGRGPLGPSGFSLMSGSGLAAGEGKERAAPRRPRKGL